ncbi:transposase [Sinorhizobium fredii]
MGSAILLRDDFDGRALRQLARQTKDANQARRLLALAEIYDGGSRSDAARIGSVTLQIVRDWVLRFNARGPDGLVNGKAPGGRAKLNVAQRHARRRDKPTSTSRATDSGVPANARAEKGRGFDRAWAPAIPARRS